jgi:hypothetical protein
LPDFFALTPAELIAALSAFRKQERVGWKQTQLLMFAAMLPHYKKLSPSDCIDLKDEDEAAPKQLSDEERDTRRKRNESADRRAKQAYLESIAIKNPN